MPRIFISHSSKQKEFVNNVVDYIGTDECIVDIYDFRPSEKIEDEIKRYIDNCQIFALFLSKEAWASDWVKFEINYVKSYVDVEKKIFRPFIIDEEMSVDDIDNITWIKSYIINRIQKSKIIARSLEYDLNQLKYKEFPYIKYKNELFFGRNEDMSNITAKFYEAPKRKALFISGIPLIGRKRFAKEVLHQLKQDDRQDFLSINMQRDESVDMFVLKLNDIIELYSKPEVIRLASSETYSVQKKEAAVALINQMYEYKQALLIIDEGCVVSQGGLIVDWFEEILRSKELKKQLGIYVCSRIALRYTENSVLPVLSIRLSPITDQSITTLIRAYSQKRSLPQDENTINLIAKGVSGSPRFVYELVDCWKDRGINAIKDKITEISSVKQNVLSYVLDDIYKDENNEKTQLLLLLSRFEYMSYNLLNTLNSSHALLSLVEDLKTMSLIEEFGSSKEYFRLHPVIIDQIRRSRKKLSSEFENELRKKTREILSNMDANTVDLSQQLFGIRNYIRAGLHQSNVLDKYFIPSIALKVIIEEYDAKRYGNVIELADKLKSRSNSNYEHLDRSVRYWLCCALCRKQDDRFFDELKHFKDTVSYNFLLGFYYRIGGKYPKAEEEYQLVLDADDGNSDTFLRAKEEMVLVKIKQGNYSDALQLAEENYKHRPYNPYFIVSYYRCLVKNKDASGSLLKQLIEEAKIVHDANSYENVSTMEAEYDYYVLHSFSSAIEKLQVILKSKPPIDYPKNALFEICRRHDAMTTYESIINELKDAFGGDSGIVR